MQPVVSGPVPPFTGATTLSGAGGTALAIKGATTLSGAGGTALAIVSATTLSGACGIVLPPLNGTALPLSSGTNHSTVHPNNPLGDHSNDHVPDHSGLFARVMGRLPNSSSPFVVGGMVGLGLGA